MGASVVMGAFVVVSGPIVVGVVVIVYSHGCLCGTCNWCPYDT